MRGQYMDDEEDLYRDNQVYANGPAPTRSYAELPGQRSNMRPQFRKPSISDDVDFYDLDEGVARVNPNRVQGRFQPQTPQEFNTNPVTNIQIDNGFRGDRDQFYEPNNGYETMDTPQVLGFNQNTRQRNLKRKSKSRERRLDADNDFKEQYGRLMNAPQGYSAPVSKQQPPDYSNKQKQRQVAYEAQERMMGYKPERERQLAELQRRKEEQYLQKEMQECTFKPNIGYNTRDGRGPQARYSAKGPQGGQNPQHFYKKEQQFLAKKQNWIDDQQFDRDSQFRAKQKNAQLMSSNSRQIMRNKNGSQTFLDRNYKKTHNEGILSRDRLNSELSCNRSQASGTSGYGGRRSRQNGFGRPQSGASFGSDYSGPGYDLGRGSRMFSPQINENSRRMSPRSSHQQTFNMLHDQAKVQRGQLEMAQFRAHQQVIQNTNKSLLQNVNETSDLSLVKSFYEEFDKMCKQSDNHGSNLYLLEALEQLQFIDADILKETNHQDAHDRYRRLKVALRDQKSNLVILEGGKIGNHDDIGKNLFKICCAILNLRPGQRGLPAIDDSLLSQYLDQININRFLLDDNLLTQFQVLKNLINRKAFSLNDRQIRIIHQKYKNFCIHRKDKTFHMNKDNNVKQIYQETQPTFAPRINSKSELLDRQSNGYQDRRHKLYNQGQAIRDRQEQQRESARRDISDRDQDHPYKPNLNKNSMNMQANRQIPQNLLRNEPVRQQPNWAGGSRQDRDPRDIEYERQQDELTFKPKTNQNFRPTSGQFGQRKPRQNSRPRVDSRQRASRPGSRSNGRQMSPTMPRPKSGAKPMSKQDPTETYARKAIEDTKRSPFRDKSLAKDRPSPSQLLQGATKQDDPRKSPTFNEPVDEEPICVLKVELDGEHTEKIKIFQNQNAPQIVAQFGEKHNLSDNAMRRLLDQINYQLEINENE